MARWFHAPAVSIVDAAEAKKAEGVLLLLLKKKMMYSEKFHTCRLDIDGTHMGICVDLLTSHVQQLLSSH